MKDHQQSVSSLWRLTASESQSYIREKTAEWAITSELWQHGQLLHRSRGPLNDAQNKTQWLDWRGLNCFLSVHSVFGWYSNSEQPSTLSLSALYIVTLVQPLYNVLLFVVVQEKPPYTTTFNCDLTEMSFHLGHQIKLMVCELLDIVAFQKVTGTLEHPHVSLYLAKIMVVIVCCVTQQRDCFYFGMKL